MTCSETEIKTDGQTGGEQNCSTRSYVEVESFAKGMDIVSAGDSYVADDSNESLIVEIQDASKSYKRTGKDSPKVLNGFNMRVPKGAIYSLLGSSGCGKTTALSCIVGLRELDEGTIKVFGHPPDLSLSGQNVGYMPQDLCLYEYLTLVETLQYFGQIYGMDDEAIKESTAFLGKLLNLEGVNNLIDTLSGGQKRRASFAIALIHKPQLLILDEPTVGVDPVLRERIWSYLRSLTDSHQSTIIVTTHYIEEARQSHVVGLMGNGKLLYENSPETLLRQTGVRLLADAVFLVYQRSESLLSSGKRSIEESETILEHEKPEQTSSKSIKNSPNSVKVTSSKKSAQLSSKTQSYAGSASSVATINSLLRRNFIQMMRNPWYLFFVLALPAVQILAGMSAIGSNPHSIKLGVVNGEPVFDEMGLITESTLKNCSSSYSCRYLSHIPQKDVVLYAYQSENEAIEAVKQSSIDAYVSFPANFTTYVKEKIISNNFADNKTLEGSEINLRRDMTDIQLALRLGQVLLTGLQDFILNVVENSQAAVLPLNFSEPIYGSEDVSHQSYIAAGIIVTLATFFPMCTISMHIISDINRGTMERTLVAGVRKTHILIGELLTHGVILIVQTALMYFIVVTFSELKVNGISMVLSAILTFLNGVLGLSFGFLLPLFCKKEVEALLLANGLILPDMIIGGLVWPAIFAPRWVQYFGFVLPHTFSGIAMNSIFSRGWGLSHSHVWPGFLSPCIWILISWLIVLKFNVLSK